MAAVSSGQKPGPVGTTQLLKRQVQRADTVLTHKQAQGNALDLSHPLPSQQPFFLVLICLGVCLLSPVLNSKLPVAAFSTAPFPVLSSQGSSLWTVEIRLKIGVFLQLSGQSGMCFHLLWQNKSPQSRPLILFQV